MLLLFIEKYADLAVRLDANIEGVDVDDNAAIQALMEELHKEQQQQPQHPQEGQNLPLPSQKEKRR